MASSPYAASVDSSLFKSISRAQKEAIRQQNLMNEDGDLATPFRRLKLVMDYWCALWFWPITAAAQLPSREQWWMEVGAILEGNVIDMTTQFELGLLPLPPGEGRGEGNRENTAPPFIPDVQSYLDGFEVQLPLSAARNPPPAHNGTTLRNKSIENIALAIIDTVSKA